MPCPACVGIAGAAVFGGGYLLVVSDPRRIVNITVAASVLISWTSYFWVKYFTELEVGSPLRVSAEVLTMIVVPFAGFRIWQLRKLGHRTPLDPIMGRGWAASAAVVHHPLVIGLKLLLLGALLLDWFTPISIEPWWYLVGIALTSSLIVIRIPRGIEAWRDSNSLSCPFGFGRKKGGSDASTSS